MIEVSLLGRVAVTVDGAALSGEAAQRRRLALLALLCIPRPQPIRRDRLMLYLWPDSDTESARHVLSVAVHVLRKALGHDALVTTADEIGLESEHLRVDVHAFEDALKAGDCEAAVAGYGGPFMDGFHAGAGVDLEQWVDGERARLQRAYAQALEGMASQRRAAGDVAGAAEAWRRRAALDPYSSPGALGLMRALAEVGNRAAAIRHAGIHKQLLEAELGAGPDPEVEALAEELRREPPPHVVAVHPPGAGAADGGTAGRRAGAAMPGGAGDPASSSGTQAIPVGAGGPGGAPSPGGTEPIPVAAGPPASSIGIQATVTAAGFGAEASGAGAAGMSADAGAGVVGAQAELTPVRGSTRTMVDGPFGPPPLRARWRATGRKRWGVVAVGVVLLALAGYVAVRWRASAASARTLAVLPCDNLSEERQNQYFVDGVAEDLRTRLGRVGLPVISRVSVMQYQKTTKSARQIGRELGARYVLECSIRRGDDQLRMSAQLIDTRSDTAVWAGSYDREFKQVLAVQSEIAQRIAVELVARLTPEQKLEVAQGGTRSTSAYDLYLRGRYAWYQRTPESLRDAIRYFGEAIAQDSSYAQAYAGWAEALVVAGGYDYAAMEPETAYRQARWAALRAVELDPKLAAAHSALAAVYMNYDWNAPEAEREFRAALKLDPDYSPAHQWYSLLLLTQKRDQEAAVEMERAAESDTTSPAMSVQRADLFYYTGQYDKAVGELQHALKLDPAFATAHLLLALTQIQLGQAARVVPRMEAMRAQVPQPVVVAVLGYAYGRAGELDKARECRQWLANAARTGYVPHELFALLDLVLGDRAAALDDLEQMRRAHSNGTIYLAIEPPMAPLRNEPRFAAIVQAAEAGQR